MSLPFTGGGPEYPAGSPGTNERGEDRGAERADARVRPLVEKPQRLEMGGDPPIRAPQAQLSIDRCTGGLESRLAKW
jgi:hypothetical protein